MAIGLATGIAQAQHAPVIFYNVPNWTSDYLHVRYATPLEAIVVPWDANQWKCLDGEPGWAFAGMYAEHVSGYEDGTFYNAYYYHKNEFTCIIDSGPYPDGATARRYAYCAGTDVWGNSADQYGYSADQFPNSMCPKPAVDPDKSRGVPTCPCKVEGDPVNPSTGNKFESVEIYRGSGAFPLSFSISYNSQHGNSSIQAPNDLVVGARRVHNYLRIIRLYSNTVSATAYALRPDGKVLGFNQSGTSWIADADVGDTLTAIYATDGSISGWMYTTGNGDQELYNSTGQLIALTAKGDLTQTLLYNATGTLASVTDPEGRILAFSYDANGRISAMQDPGGLAYGFSYDSNNNLKTITYSDSSVLTLVYGENGAGANDLTGVIDESSNRIDTTQYDSSDRATSTSGPNGIGKTSFGYAYNSSTATPTYTVTDPLGKAQTTSTEYLLGTVHPLNVSQTCAGCNTVSKQYSYDINGYLSSASDFNGNTTKTTYDASGLLNQQIEAFGQSSQRTTNFTWNATLRVPLTRTVSGGTNTVVAKTSWAYNGTGQTIGRCDANPNVAGATSYSCGSGTNAPAGVRQWTYTYCNAVDGIQCPLAGILLTVDGPRTDVADVTHYSYYMSTDESGCGTLGGACHRAGDLYQATNAMGQVVTIMAYTKNGQIARQSNSNGVITDFTYHPRGWLLIRTVRANADGSSSASDAVATITYKAYGSVESITDPDGVKVTYTYDAAHRLTDITDALGDRIHYTLDAAGNKTKEETFDPSGTVRRTLSRTYNTLGQLTQVTDGLTNAVFTAAYTDSYDGNGNLVHSVDALGIQRKQSYDGLNRLQTTIDNYNGTDQATQNTQSTFAYDALDRLQGFSDPDSLSTAYGYDGLGNATSVQSPDTGSVTNQYDSAGNLTQHTDARSVVTQYTYDALNRRKQIIYPAHPNLNVTYTYDQSAPIAGCPGNFNVGHLTTMTDASGTTSWCYTNQGDIREVKQTINGVTYLHGYAYTAGRRLKYLQYPSGFELLYGFDAAGRVNSIGYLQQPGPYGSYTNNTITPLITGVSYFPFGQVSGYTWASGGQSVARAMDANGQVTDVTSGALNLHFRRDNAGNIAAAGVLPGANPATESYQYDPLSRLKELDDGSGAAEQSFTYNRTGDRLSATIGTSPAIGYTYQTNSHRLSAVGGLSRPLDANGNTTALTAPNGLLVGLGYDDRNLLTAVTNGSSTIASYQYDGLGNRVWRTITYPSGGQMAAVYDPAGTGNLYGEYFAADYREYVYLNGIPVASATDAGLAAPIVSYLHADHLGTVRCHSGVEGCSLVHMRNFAAPETT